MSKRNPIASRQLVRQGELIGLYRTEISKRVISSVAAGAGVGFGSYVINDVPVGQLLIFGVKAGLAFRKLDNNIIATWSANWSLGSTPDADGSLAGTEVNLIPSTAIGPAVAGVIAAPAAKVYNAATLATPIALDNVNGALELNLNLVVAAASQTDATTGLVQVDGFIDLLLAVL